MNRVFWIFLIGLVTYVAAADLRLHYYDTSEPCGGIVQSLYYYSFDIGVCYRNWEIQGYDGCSYNTECLAKKLDWSDYQQCLADNNNLTLSLNTGSFQVALDTYDNFFIHYGTGDCTGDFVEETIKDDCHLTQCSNFVRVQQFPRPTQEYSSSSDDDDLAISEGAIVGISIGGASLIVLVCLACVCCIMCCIGLLILASLVIIPIMITVFIIFKIKNYQYKDHEEGDTTLTSRVIRVIQTRQLDSIQRPGKHRGQTATEA